MKYNFDEVIDRRNSDSVKWDVLESELPMWIADMDFKTAPEIITALEKRVSHGVFGYSDIPDEWYEAISNRWERRHNFKIEKEWLCFCTGVVAAISSIVRKVTTVGEKVAVMTPVYNIFFNSIVNNGRYPIISELVYGENGYSIDFNDLEEKLADPQTTLLILCNPQNPIGKIWDRETLNKIGELCYRYNVLVVSDEIHCELTDPDCDYVPFASVSEVCRDNSITCIAPTKAYNIAGLHSAAVFVPNPTLRHKVNRGLNTDEVAEPNAFAITATIAAFNNGDEWLDELREYIYTNKKLVEEFIKKEIPKIKLTPSRATYLLWLDCNEVGENSTYVAEHIRKASGLFLTDGSHYGKGGEHFLRMNIACPKSTLLDGLERLKKGIESLTVEK